MSKMDDSGVVSLATEGWRVCGYLPCLSLPHVVFLRCASLFFSVLCKDESVKHSLFFLFFLRILIISCFIKDTLELTGKGKHTNNQDGQTKKRHHKIDFFF